MAGKACSDTGPILHLHEIKELFLLKVFDKVFISTNIKEELLKYEIENLSGNIVLKKINNDQTALLAERYGLDIGESSVIWLCKSLDVFLLLTDDLTAREAAIELELKPVGSVGIIVRCFREKTITSRRAIDSLRLLQAKSSLFITTELINYAVAEVKKFKGLH